MPHTAPSIAKTSFTDFADAFLRLHRAGHRPSIEEAIAEFPELEEEIRQKVPAMLMIENAMVDGPAKPQLHVDNTVAGCIVEQELGRGAFGIVFKAFQPELNRRVAIKAMQLGPDNGLGAERFMLESKAMAKLSHPNIVPVYGFYRSDNIAYLIMKLIDGQSFEQVMSPQADYRAKTHLGILRSDWTKFAELARDIASGLAHAHAAKLVHRDVKPSNLMLDSSGKPWITDFGLAKIYDYTNTLTLTGDVVGTPRYMAPEQLRGHCDARSDIYALGLTLYELATGFQVRDSIGEIAGNQSAGQDIGERSQDVPETLRQVIQKACAFSPEERYQTADELQIVLSRFIQGQTPDRRRAKRKSDAEYRRDSRKKMLALSAASVLAFGGALYGANSIRLSIKKPVAKGSPTLLEHLADDPQHGITEFLRDTARESIVSASMNMGLEENEKEVLINRFDRFLTNLDARADQQIVEVNNELQSSGLLVGLRVMYLNHIISDSSLADAEKRAGRAAIRRLAFLVARGEVTQEKSEDLIAQLSAGKRLKLSELKTYQVSDEVLATWLQELAGYVERFDVENIDIQSEIERFFEESESQLEKMDQELAAQQAEQLKQMDQAEQIQQAEQMQQIGQTDERPKHHQLSEKELQQMKRQKLLEEQILSLPPELQQRALEQLRRAGIQ